MCIRDRYYITAYNEPMQQPAEPEDADIEGIVKGMHLINEGDGDANAPHAQLLASGVGVPWALEAQRLLKEDWGVVADVWSVTSWGELRRDGLECDEQAFLHPELPVRTPFVTQKLAGRPGPVLATSDYTVSYTHLDVYKRQLRDLEPGVQETRRLGALTGRDDCKHLTIFLCGVVRTRHWARRKSTITDCRFPTT